MSFYHFRTTRLGLKLSIRSDLLEKGKDLPARKAKALGRAAMQAAVRPMVAGLKQITTRTAAFRGKTLYGQSQATGATGRAIGQKVGISRRNNLYGKVAVDTHYVEMHQPNTTLYSIWAKRKGRNIGTTTTGGRSRKKFLYVKSFSTRSINPRRRLKRRPSKYWPLINLGFTHRSGTRFRGYWFVHKTMLTTRSEAIAAFERIWYAGIRRMFYGPMREDLQ